MLASQSGKSAEKGPKHLCVVVVEVAVVAVAVLVVVVAGVVVGPNVRVVVVVVSLEFVVTDAQCFPWVLR